MDVENEKDQKIDIVKILDSIDFIKKGKARFYLQRLKMKFLRNFGAIQIFMIKFTTIINEFIQGFENNNPLFLRNNKEDKLKESMKEMNDLLMKIAFPIDFLGDIVFKVIDSIMSQQFPSHYNSMIISIFFFFHLLLIIKKKNRCFFCHLPTFYQRNVSYQQISFQLQQIKKKILYI